MADAGSRGVGVGEGAATGSNNRTGLWSHALLFVTPDVPSRAQAQVFQMGLAMLNRLGAGDPLAGASAGERNQLGSLSLALLVRCLGFDFIGARRQDSSGKRTAC